jgi:lipopolysaccharide transport system permease protein
MTGEAISTGVSSVLANRAILSNTVFPVDLIPAKSVLMSQVTMAVGMGILLFGLAYTQAMSIAIVFLPLIWLLHIMALLGVTWIISLVNLVFRDLQNLVSPLLMILMIISPIAYTPEMVPPGLKFLVLLNPFAYYIIAYQKVLVLGLTPGRMEWIAVFSISLSLFWFGGWFFTRAKRSLIDYV